MLLYQQYRVRNKIDDALYGGIWLCEDTKDNNHLVAIKQVSLIHARQALASNTHMDNPWHERRIITMLMQFVPHENIVLFRHEFVANGSWFLVMEYCDSGDLLQFLYASSPDHRLPESTAMEIFTQIAHGVRFLHQNGIAHRDLSLENVLMHGSCCKIGDFGLSTDAIRIGNERVGKAYYMAPEVVAAIDYDPKAADMWSLGIMLFIMLTGSPLTPSASVDEKAFQAVATFGVQKILAAWGMSSNISTDTMDLLTGLLRVDPARRFTIEEVLMHPTQRMESVGIEGPMETTCLV